VQEVEFEHRRLKPGTLPPSIAAGQREAQALGRTMSARARIWRVVIVLLGAASIAWSTQRLGLEFGTSLCLFIGALPVLWVLGWLFGMAVSMLWHVRRTKQKHLRVQVGSMNWQNELEQVTVVEKVKMAVTGEGLKLTRDGAEQLVPWAAVKVDRVDAKTFAVFLLNEVSGLAMNEALPVPRSAFASDDSFDGFCLEVQKHVWEAQR